MVEVWVGGWWADLQSNFVLESTALGSPPCLYLMGDMDGKLPTNMILSTLSICILHEFIPSPP